MRRNRGEWKGIVERYESGTVTKREFCRREGISEPSLIRWIKIMASDEVVSSGFVEIEGGAAERDGNPIGVTLRLPGGIVIEIGVGAGHELLSWVADLVGRSA